MSEFLGGILQEFHLEETEAIMKKLLEEARPIIHPGLSTIIVSLLDRKSENLIIKWHAVTSEYELEDNVKDYFEKQTPIPKGKSKMWEILNAEIENRSINGVTKKSNYYIAEDPQKTNPSFINTLKGGTNISFYLPLYYNGVANEIIGIFAVDSILKGDFKTRENLIYSFGKFIETTIIALHKAYYDSLIGKMGVFGIAYFEPLVRNWININKKVVQGEQNLNLYLCFMDLNEFKKINDKHGHRIGDEVLKHFGKIILEAKEKYEEEKKRKGWLFRRGGDEFILLLESKNYEEVRMFIKEELDKKIEESPYNFSKDENISLSVSCGVANISDLLDSNSSTLEELVDNLELHSDEVMYFSKQLVKKGLLRKRSGIITTFFDKAGEYVKKIKESEKNIENIFREYIKQYTEEYPEKFRFRGD